MSTFWTRLRNRLFAPPPPEDAPPLPAAAHAPALSAPDPNFPATFRSAVHNDAVRVHVFDPALKHLPRAFRPGDPKFASDDTARHWAGLRRRATDHVLRAIAESELGYQLILRGSRLLKAWLGDSAREPGDLDFLVDPPTLGPESWDRGMNDRLVAVVFARPAPAGIELVREGVAVDDIWTYERAEGRRVVFPWRAAGLPGAAVQVDVVFREELVEPDRQTIVPAADGGCVMVRAAGPAQALAWKLLWLATDWYPQGKDLFDAVLLAERFALPYSVLRETFQRANTPLPATPAGLVPARGADWKNFRAEYPWIGGTAADWTARLTNALAPTFDGSGAERPAEVAPALESEWLTTTVVQLARGIDTERAYDGLPILADALQEAGCDDETILTHCRCGGPHAHGCWVVNLILGKE